MSAVVYQIPAERIVRRPHEIPCASRRGVVVVTHDGQSLVFDSPQDFWETCREDDPELRRQLETARAAAARAEDLERRAQALLDEADRRLGRYARGRRRLHSFLAVATVVAATCVLGWLA